MIQRKVCKNRIDLDETSATGVAAIAARDRFHNAEMVEVIGYVIAEIQQPAGKPYHVRGLGEVGQPLPEHGIGFTYLAPHIGKGGRRGDG
ncbi:hypothetical protein GHA01_27400 [Novacetimonas hansenii]|uniref:Uncharacterized protein n=1 Tax=Novacetimonas hansenii TaxID=436 RepID=A0ABQ0SHI0_NOVHA|nr:hypothetical protein Gaha_0158_020 [Novacetimonas hansenii JCM 7643]GEC64891.1 hypothetical protein GHA01_27400 [Novacetimonas hansenii]